MCITVYELYKTISSSNLFALCEVFCSVSEKLIEVGVSMYHYLTNYSMELSITRKIPSC
jgi:hypothetical protein